MHEKLNMQKVLSLIDVQVNQLVIFWLLGYLIFIPFIQKSSYQQISLMVKINAIGHFFVYRDKYLSCLSRDVQNVTSQGLSVVLIPPLSSFIRFILEKSCDVIGLSCSDSRLRKVAAFSGVSVIVPCSALSVNSDYRRNFIVIIYVSNLN